jgi:hypothetical protein
MKVRVDVLLIADPLMRLCDMLVVWRMSRRGRAMASR